MKRLVFPIFLFPGNDYPKSKLWRHQRIPRVIRSLHARGVTDMQIKGKSEPRRLSQKSDSSHIQTKH